ncbi:MAG: NAD(+)/NADH kinase, partial [Oscillospiraceae bacterium]|nr:NAD(+)/NADH kinase [Oscillospiraceae bacterium]
MKNVILTPNPYRDKNFQTVRDAMAVLKSAGIEPKICLPFDVDRSFELPRDIRFSKLDRELPNAELVICFGGDGTILHMAKTATRKGLPILGVNIGTMGFMAELESTELDKL